MPRTIVRIPGIIARTGYSRSTIYLRISQGLWPKLVRLGPRCVGSPDDEIEAMNGARIGGMSDDAIRTLVLELEAARKAGK